MIHEPDTRPVTRIPELRNRPSFDQPWKLAHGLLNVSYWWRIDEAGTIYRVDLPDGDVRRY